METEKRALRGPGYALLADVAERGVTPATLPLLRAIPELAASLPSSIEWDIAAAEHYDIFGLQVPVWQSVYLDAGGAAGAASCDRLFALYAHYGYHSPSGLEFDSLAAQLRYLAALCDAESAPSASSIEAEVARQGQRSLLADHLLCWLAPFVEAIARNGSPFYRAWAGLLFEFAADHALDLPFPETSVAMPAPRAAPDPADANTDAQALIEWLCTPRDAGLLLSGRDLTRIAATYDLAMGRGDRRGMLRNLLRAAGEFDLLAGVVAALDNRFADAGAAYASRRGDAPHLDSWIRAWEERVATTRAMLTSMAHVSAARS